MYGRYKSKVGPCKTHFLACGCKLIVERDDVKHPVTPFTPLILHYLVWLDLKD